MKTTSSRDSEATKARLLAAATDDFAEYGIAGARVDRIARAAGSNKQLIYAYFGSKEKLFEAVIDTHLSQIVEGVPLDPLDLPGYAGRLFDYYMAHPKLIRLATWARLEHPSEEQLHEGLMSTYGKKLDALSKAMSTNELDSSFEPTELLALIDSLTMTWMSTTPELLALDSEEPFSVEAVRRHRSVVVEAVRRLISPPS